MGAELRRIHFVPFYETLPSSYNFNPFADYLKPFLKANKHVILRECYDFTFQGVHFKVACCEPKIGRIGRRTHIHTDGAIFRQLSEILPSNLNLISQISYLPPGLQLLLLNTET